MTAAELTSETITEYAVARTDANEVRYAGVPMRHFLFVGTITASGDFITFPKISTLVGFKVNGKASQPTVYSKSTNKLTITGGAGVVVMGKAWGW
jgi:hypothetical protein